MKSRIHIAAARIFVLAILATTALATWVEARQITGGKFRLPYEVRWGARVLPAGEYRFRVDLGTNLPYQVTVYTTEGARATILVGEASECGSCSDSFLIVTRRDGRRRIGALHVPGFRGVFYLPRSKQAQPELALKAERVEQVAIVADGK